MKLINETLVIFPDAIINDEVINKVQTIFIELNAKILLNNFFCLRASKEAEETPKKIIDENDALNRIIENPFAGWIQYSFKGCTILVSFISLTPLKINGILLSAFAEEYEFQKTKLNVIINQLHMEFKALRTIQGINIFDDFEPEEEILRVNRGSFIGKYKIDMR